MRKIKNILIPIDFSIASINALKYGIEIAKINQSDLHVIHSFRLIDTENTINNNQAVELKAKLKLTLERELKALKDTYAKNSGVNTFFNLHLGFPEDVIESILLKQNMDIIIMGSSGEGNSTNLLGSTLSSVVNLKNISILALSKEGNHTIPYHTILELFEQKEQIQIKDNNNSGLISIANKDFENLKESLTKKKESEKILNPIFIYC
jgi:nucleotide-binding universal stress UspA family protein